MSISIGHAYLHLWHIVQSQTHGVLRISSSIPRRTIRRNFLGSNPSMPDAGHPLAQAPQVRQKSRLPPPGIYAFKRSLKAVFLSVKSITSDISYPPHITKPSTD